MARSETADLASTVVPNPELRVPPVDGLRGLAALVILAFHCWVLTWLPGSGAASSLVLAGNYAVDAFFVISGFVLFLPVLHNGSLGNIGQYARRRVARILPGYYVAFAFALLFFGVASVPDVPHPLSTGSGWVALSFHLVLLQTWLLGTVGAYFLNNPWAIGFGVIGTVWTLTIEATFYATLPLVARWYRDHPIRGLAIAMAVSIAWRVGMWAIQGPVPATAADANPANVFVGQWIVSLPAFAGEFAAGMTAAWLSVRWRRVCAPPVSPSVLIAVGTAAFVAVTWPAGHRLALAGIDIRKDVFLFVGANLLAGLSFSVAMLGVALSGSRLSAALGGRVAGWFATRTYGIYLWHFPIIMLIRQHLPTNAAPPIIAALGLLVATLPLTLAAADLSWRFVERPAIAWARRSRSAPGGATASPADASQPA